MNNQKAPRKPILLALVTLAALSSGGLATAQDYGAPSLPLAPGIGMANNRGLGVLLDVNWNGYGARVTGVYAGSPASRTRAWYTDAYGRQSYVQGPLDRGDVITSINGIEVGSYAELQAVIAEILPGERVGIEGLNARTNLRTRFHVTTVMR